MHGGESVCSAWPGDEATQLLLAVRAQSTPCSLSNSDLTHFKQKCIKCCISTLNMGISWSV